jgi:hypothetical protein
MMSNHLPWQIEMFRRSIKKQQKLRALLELLGETTGEKCLLVTCGDNNGALNWHFRNHGGEWTWADVSGETTIRFPGLSEPVYAFREDDFPVPGGLFDCVVPLAGTSRSGSAVSRGIETSAQAGWESSGDCPQWGCETSGEQNQMAIWHDA